MSDRIDLWDHSDPKSKSLDGKYLDIRDLMVIKTYSNISGWLGFLFSIQDKSRISNIE